MSSPAFHRILLAVFAGTLFLAAALLFYIQPMIGKMLLPRAGGAPAVWNVAMAFFQLALLAGYGLAHWLGRLPVRVHALVYLLALAGAWFTLPLALPEGWQMEADSAPALSILTVLLQSAFIPFVVLSLSAPTLQRLFAGTGHPQAHDPYFLYAASNLGSFTGLLAYPVLIEPLLAVSAQSRLWQTLFVILLGLAGLACLLLGRTRPVADTVSVTQSAAALPVLSWRRRLYWMLLAFIPSSLTLGVTTYITTDVAATPLLWVLTLALYLFTYILAFARRGAGLRAWALRWAPWFGAAAAATQVVGIPLPLPVMFLHVSAFFVVALGCHSLLAQDRPAAGHLTTYYLCLSVGGALGGSFNAFLAPLLFTKLLEYPLVLLMALGLGFPMPGWLRDPVRRQYVALGLLLFVGLTLLNVLMDWVVQPLLTSGAMALFVVGLLVLLRHQRQLFAIVALVLLVTSGFSGYFHNRVYTGRDFFGVVGVLDQHDEPTGQTLRYFMHGTTVHGIEIIGPQPVLSAQGYYAPGSPIGTVWDLLQPQAVAVTGLGSGALNCYARPGQQLHFIEIDPLVVEVARTYFDYLTKCPAPEITIADGRLAFMRDTRHYDLIVLDAFASDSVPAHLLTREAFELYLQHLNPGGAIAIHISNRFFAMTRMLAPLGDSLGLQVLHARSMRNEVLPGQVFSPTEWVVMAPQAATLAPLLERYPDLWEAAHPDHPVTPWTDDFSNLVSVLKYERR